MLEMYNDTQLTFRPRTFRQRGIWLHHGEQESSVGTRALCNRDALLPLAGAGRAAVDDGPGPSWNDGQVEGNP
jgi:hypothetical protein